MMTLTTVTEIEEHTILIDSLTHKYSADFHFQTTDSHRLQIFNSERLFASHLKETWKRENWSGMLRSNYFHLFTSVLSNGLTN